MVVSYPITEMAINFGFSAIGDRSGELGGDVFFDLFKGSGRVNRILGPEEELAGILGKSLRQAIRQSEARRPDCGKRLFI